MSRNCTVHFLIWYNTICLQITRSCQSGDGIAISLLTDFIWEGRAPESARYKKEKRKTLSKKKSIICTYETNGCLFRCFLKKHCYTQHSNSSLASSSPHMIHVAGGSSVRFTLLCGRTDLHCVAEAGGIWMYMSSNVRKIILLLAARGEKKATYLGL